MTSDPGVELPDAALAGVRRRRHGTVRTSLLSAGAAVALHAVGLTPVGDVLGCTARSLVRRMFRCGWDGATGLRADDRPSPVLTSGSVPDGEGLAGWATGRTLGFREALDRLLAQAAAIGADGVVDVRLTETHGDSALQEYVALGTAVRVDAGTDASFPGRADGPGAGAPFATTLDGPGTARLLASGWWPAGIAVGLSAAIRHQDRFSRAGAGQVVRVHEPGELVGLSDLLAAARADARDRLAEDGRRVGGEHLAVTSFTTRTLVRQWGESHVDDVAQTTAVATVLRARADGPAVAAPARTLTVLPLSDSGRAFAGRPAPADTAPSRTTGGRP